MTSFDDKSCACGPCNGHGPYFAADKQRYGCGAKLNVCRGGKCVKLVVVDYGPSCFVEQNAGKKTEAFEQKSNPQQGEMNCDVTGEGRVEG